MNHLLTSFTTWKDHQRSNAADDLFVASQPHLHTLSSHTHLHYLRHLPVNVPIAFQLITTWIQRHRPQVILCCGMAEQRQQLNLEAQAVVGDRVYRSAIDLESLAAGLSHTTISTDAGRFVCNGIYYALLHYLQQHSPTTHCLFLHVPPLSAANRSELVADFCEIVDRLSAYSSPVPRG